jgi:4-hydroxy-tetrahydrodipicolinate synthase
MSYQKLPKGIISVLQTPFFPDGKLDEDSLLRLVEDAIAAGVDGFLAPVVASELSALTASERQRIISLVAGATEGRVPLIVGASSDEPAVCRGFAKQAADAGATAFLVAVPSDLYRASDRIVRFFLDVAQGSELPLVIQDLQFNGPGMDLDTIAALARALPSLAGFKIETTPAGPKYSAVRQLLGEEVWIAGGWAVPQMIETLDRGVDAMIPESAMVRVYKAVDRAFRLGDRQRAVDLFRQLVPVLSFANQELYTSIAFFKRLLAAKKVFADATVRPPGFEWDDYSRRIADELISHYLDLENEIAKPAGRR